MCSKIPAWLTSACDVSRIRCPPNPTFTPRQTLKLPNHSSRHRPNIHRRQHQRFQSFSYSPLILSSHVRNTYGSTLVQPNPTIRRSHSCLLKAAHSGTSSISPDHPRIHPDSATFTQAHPFLPPSVRSSRERLSSLKDITPKSCLDNRVNRVHSSAFHHLTERTLSSSRHHPSLR